MTACAAGFADGIGCFPCRIRQTTNPRPRTASPRPPRDMGREPAEFAYDLLLENNGKTLLYRPLSNYSYGNLDTVHDMLAHDATIVGLGDGGAHVGILSDASALSTMLTHWTRDRERRAVLAAVGREAHHA